MTMKEIGATLDLSESRVSQMHSSIVARLQQQLAARRPLAERDQEVFSTSAPNPSLPAHSGLTRRRSLRWSMCPTRRTPPHELNAVWRPDARSPRVQQVS
jgi:hypothetical protein